MRNVPDEQRQAGKTAGKEISRTDKGFHIECGNDRRNENEHYPPKMRTDAFDALFNNFMYRLSHRRKHIVFSHSWQMKYALPIIQYQAEIYFIVQPAFTVFR